MTTPAFQAPSPGGLALVPAGVPDFEGIHVASTKTQITGTVPVEADNDLVVSIDDRVRLVGEYRVVGVRFEVDPKTGDTVRVQMLKPINVTTCPFNPQDPTDDGILRARPRV